MEFNNKLPEWENEGAEPSSDRRKKGFETGYKPPAGIFNWFWSKVSKAITELQTKFGSHAENKGNPHGVTVAQIGAASASQHNIHSYTTLEQCGLFDSEMSDTDLQSNIDKIVTALDDNAATLMFIIQNNVHPNLHASVVEKLNADTDITFRAADHAGWLSIHFSGEAYRPVFIEVSLETANYYDRVWTCVYNKGSNGNVMSDFESNKDVVPIERGGTGGKTVETVRENLGFLSTQIVTIGDQYKKYTDFFYIASSAYSRPVGKAVDDIFAISVTIDGSSNINASGVVATYVEGSSKTIYLHGTHITTTGNAYIISGTAEIDGNGGIKIRVEGFNVSTGDKVNYSSDSNSSLSSIDICYK